MTSTSHLFVLALICSVAGCAESTSVGEGGPSQAAAPAAPVAAVTDKASPASKPAETTPLASAAPTPTPEPATNEVAKAPEKMPASSIAADPAAPTATSAPAAKPILEPVKFDEFRSRVAAGKHNGKFTMVDVWATWCEPCKENFPHVVEMNKKYGDKGLVVISLSFDDPTESKQVEDAKKFLASKKADFTNLLLDEEVGIGNEKLNVNSIPAVFIYGPEGQELKRFTMDDPNHQFTYDEVEKTVVALLEGKPLPKEPLKEKESKPAEK